MCIGVGVGAPTMFWIIYSLVLVHYGTYVHLFMLLIFIEWKLHQTFYPK